MIIDYVNICPCRDLLPFKENSSLLKYLETHCKGWVVSPSNRYTLNYVLIVLLANLREKGFLQTKAQRYLCVKGDSVFRKIEGFRAKITQVSSLRHIIASRHFNTAENSKYTTFLCPKESRSIIYSVLRSPVSFHPSRVLIDSIYIYDHCDNRQHPSDAFVMTLDEARILFKDRQGFKEECPLILVIGSQKMEQSSEYV